MANTNYNSFNGFPSNDIPKEEKGASWHLDYAKAILGLYYQNRTAMSRDIVADIQKNRTYATGQQDIAHIRSQFELSADSLGGTGTPFNMEQLRKGMANVNWEVVSEIPKLLNIITGIVQKEKSTIGVYAVDEMASTERQKKKWNMWLASAANRVVSEMGVNQMVEDVDFDPEKIQELEMYSGLGGLKMAIEVNLQKAISMVFRDSKWDEDLLRKVIMELFANNMAGTKDYVDIDGRVKTRFVDIANAIYEYSPVFEFDDMQFAGEIIMRSMKEVRQLSGLDETELQRFLMGSTVFLSTYASFAGDWRSPLTNGAYVYDNFKIPVFEFEFLNTNTDFYKSKVDKRGAQRTFKEDYIKGFDPRKSPNIKRISELTVHKCSHILNSDIVYDYGEVMAGAPGEKPRLSYNFVRLPGPSLVNRLIPLADTYYLNWVKFQNALAMAPPAGLAYDWDAISNMMLGAGKLKPRDVIRMRIQSGNMPYKYTDPFGRPTGHLPFQELEGGIGRQFDEFYRSFELFDNLIQRITGFTDIAAAISPAERQGKAVSEMAFEATHNALFTILNRTTNLKKAIAETAGYRIQMLARHGGYEVYYHIFGENTMEIFKLGAEEGMARIGITMIPVPTSSARQSILEAARVAMQAGKNGMPLLTMSDFLFIKRQLDMENLRMAEMYLVYKESKARAEQQQMSEKTIAAQSEASMQQAQISLQLDVERDKQYTDNKIRLAYYTEMFKQESMLSEAEKNILHEYAKPIFASVVGQQQVN